MNKRFMKNINEEVSRIKRLFGEELLWGNMVNETNPDTDGNKVIDADEFSVSGDEISGEEAIEFVQTLSTNEPSVASVCFKEEIIKKSWIFSKAALSTPNIWPSLSKGVKMQGGMCNILITQPTPSPTQWSINRVQFWEDNELLVFLKLPKKIDFSSSNNLSITMPNVPVVSPLRAITTLGPFLTGTKDILYVRYKCNYTIIDSDPNNGSNAYGDLTIDGFYDSKGKRTMDGMRNNLLDPDNGIKYGNSGVTNTTITSNYDVSKLWIDGLGLPVNGPLAPLLKKLKV